MREIVFRGKSVETGEWVYGYFVGYRAETYIFEPKEVHNGIDLGGYLDCCKMTEVDPATVGQYTGLKDKNGKRIFEGDVFEWGYAGVKEFRYVIVYDAELASFVGERHYGFVSLNGIDIEIIGNIHDNPDLLDGN